MCPSPHPPLTPLPRLPIARGAISREDADFSASPAAPSVDTCKKIRSPVKLKERVPTRDGCDEERGAGGGWERGAAQPGRWGGAGGGHCDLVTREGCAPDRFSAQQSKLAQTGAAQQWVGTGEVTASITGSVGQSVRRQELPVVPDKSARPPFRNRGQPIFFFWFYFLLKNNS